MKKIFLILLTAVLFSCNNDDATVFNVDPAEVQINFTPYEGGCYVDYTLPGNTDIYGIKLTYKDFQGKRVSLIGTHTNSALNLFGFHKPVTNHPVEIRLVDKNGNESKVEQKTFSTLESVSLSIFNDLEVFPHWNGFRLSLPAVSESSSGALNVYYVGKNKETGTIDTIFVDMYAYSSKSRTVLYSNFEPGAYQDIDVVLRSEDNRGNFVKTEVYNVSVEEAVKFDGEIKFEGSSMEVNGATERTGAEYLFDGDKTGLQNFKYGKSDRYYSFISEPKAEFDSVKNVFSLDLGVEKEIAGIRIYSHLSAQLINSRTGSGFVFMKQDNELKYPSKVTLYGAESADAPESEWVKIGSYSQDGRIDAASTGLSNISDKWIYPSVNKDLAFYPDQLNDFMEKAEKNPCFISASCLITGTSYRYLKLRVNETFYRVSSEGTVSGKTGQIAMEELEVYVKK